MKAIIAYLSYSGNTEEIAELIQKKLQSEDCEVLIHRIRVDQEINPNDADLFFIGTFTWEHGSVPEEIKDFILEIGYKPENTAIFGSGDTQFGGDEWFCRAVDKLVKFYESPWEGLKVEQSPRGIQEEKTILWVERVLQHVKISRESKNVTTSQSK